MGSQLIPAAVTGSAMGSAVTDPRLLKIVSVNDTNVKAKNAVSGLADTDSSGFYALIDRGYGAYADMSLSVPADHTPICDITGSGSMFHVIGHAPASGTVTIHIDRDGELYDIPLIVATRYRAVLGSTVSGNTLPTTGLPIWGGPYSDGYSITNKAIGAANVCYVPAYDEILGFGLPYLRFNTKLTVSISSTGLPDNINFRKRASVFYLLD